MLGKYKNMKGKSMSLFELNTQYETICKKIRDKKYLKLVAWFFFDRCEAYLFEHSCKHRNNVVSRYYFSLILT